MSCHAFPKRSPDHSPRAAVGHMPFPGHRTQETIRLQQEAARKGRRMAMEFGFDPDSLAAHG
jgi:hypothetical protein